MERAFCKVQDVLDRSLGEMQEAAVKDLVRVLRNCLASIIINSPDQIDTFLESTGKDEDKWAEQFCTEALAELEQGTQKKQGVSDLLAKLKSAFKKKTPREIKIRELKAKVEAFTSNRADPGTLYFIDIQPGATVCQLYPANNIPDVESKKPQPKSPVAALYVKLHLPSTAVSFFFLFVHPLAYPPVVERAQEGESFAASNVPGDQREAG